jgi:hypothetical protein
MGFETDCFLRIRPLFDAGGVEASAASDSS